MAETYKARPSELVGVDDPYAAWCLDEVTYTWGTAVEAAVENARASQDDPELARAAASAELERVLREPVVDESGEEVVPKGRFRDPAQDFEAARARRRP